MLKKPRKNICIECNKNNIIKNNELLGLRVGFSSNDSLVIIKKWILNKRRFKNNLKKITRLLSIFI